MKTYFDCIPCFVNQTLSAARMATEDQQIHEQLLRQILKEISTMDMHHPPPVMGRDIHRLIRETVGSRDPYKRIKERFNRLARKVYPEMENKVRQSANPLETALRIAIAGNIIDFGARATVARTDVLNMIEHSFSASIFGDFSRFERIVSMARNIMYLTDNTGEIVLDRLLVERLGPERVTVGVRGSPVINDATREDAEYAGLTGLVRVLDNGTDIPGTVIPECSADFRQAFEEADLIIAKGQGNYETLSEVGCHRAIYFLFQTKCAVAARDVGCEKGRFVVWSNYTGNV